MFAPTRLLVLAGLLCWSVAQSQPQPPQSKQAIYDTAQAAFDKHAWASAATGFGQLLPAEPSRPLKPSEAVIASRYADALMHLDRLDEAEGWIDRVLPVLPKDDPAGLAVAWLTKGEVERFRYDYEAAIKAYDQADALLGPLGVSDLLVDARLGAAYAGVTVDPAHVSERLGALLADPAFLKIAPRDLLAKVEDLRARAALNAGDKATATRLSEKAVDDSGGLSREVTPSQAAIRADAGIIARLRGDDAMTRKYFTFTGAGHLPKNNWVNDHSGDLPVCADNAEGVLPSDSVVVAFAIADDGRVVGALPIYASRPGRVGVTFARAVNGWRWNPDALKGVNAYWRATLQLELRCIGRPRPQQLGRSVWQEATDWLVQRSLITPAEADRSVVEGALRLRSDDPRFQAPGGVVLTAIAGNAQAWNGERVQALWLQLDAAQAPAAARAILIDRWAGSEGARMWTMKSYDRAKADTIGHYLPALRERYPADRSVAWLTLEQALAYEDGGDFGLAQPVLATLLGEHNDTLASDDPLTRVAQLHQAITLDRAGDTAAARRSLEQSGLTADQCSLFDTHPIASSKKVEGDTYPVEAVNWQFEGFAQEAFDIGDDGTVKNVRTVVAYPPYIFEASTEKAVAKFTYIPPKLGGKSVGCQAQTQTMTYRIAD